MQQTDNKSNDCISCLFVLVLKKNDIANDPINSAKSIINQLYNIFHVKAVLNCNSPESNVVERLHSIHI